MIKKNHIPKWLLLILIIIVLGSLLTYFLISKSPRIEDLFINLSATVLGILITLFIVDRIIKYYEWKEFEKIISNQIIDILFTLSNFMNLNSNLWQEWTKILNNDKSKKEKLKDYIKLFQSLELNKDYIFEIIKDDHLIEFFSSGYNGTYKRLDEFFSLFNNRLSAKQNTQIIRLKLSISNLTSNMNLFKSLNFMQKEFKIPIDEKHLNDFLNNARTTILIIEELLITL